MKQRADEREFVRQVTDGQGIIHNICRIYCADPEERSDLFQEILIQLWKAYPSFRGQSKFTTWMYRIGLNVALQRLRKQGRQHVFEQFSPETYQIAADDTADGSEEKIQWLHRAIAHLSDIEKAIVLLYLEEKNYAEISEIIGISQNYVRVKMTRIRSKLRSQSKKDHGPIR